LTRYSVKSTPEGVSPVGAAVTLAVPIMPVHVVVAAL
jgi:hypothetical protein